MNLLFVKFATMLAGLDSFVQYINQFKGQIKTAVLAIYDIVMYLCFGAAAILVLVMIIANQRGANVGFSAGEWAIRAGVAAGALFACKSIFGI
ncbi:MAG: hypothetical protein E6Q36_01645 [Chryseobacterium sp.]|nr:MAG: hypothetical protein E6Q36_01645 [Chryseobacterium sp.]